MKKVPPRGICTRGIDVSHYDETIDFQKLKAAGIVFVTAKCTEGILSADRRYPENKAKAKAAGILFGAYHFFRPGLDAKSQAKFFLKNAKIEKGEMIPMFDWELSSHSGDVEKAKVFLDHVEEAIGKKMIIYGPSYLLDAFKLGPEFKEYPLWIANYGTKAPSIPNPWETWSFWQYSDRGSVEGIPAPDEDLDLFNGPPSNVLKFTV